VNHRHRVAAAGGGEEDHIIPGTEIVVPSNLLRADVTVRNLHLVESQAPPAFTLRAQPGMQQSDASGAHWMRLDRWSAGQSYSLQPEGRNFPAQRFCLDLADDERPARVLVPSGFKRLLGSLDRSLFQTEAKSR